MLRLLLACGLMISPLLGRANSVSRFVLSVTSGAKYEFFISNAPEILYQDNQLNISDNKNLTVAVNAADVSGFEFFPSEAGVEFVEMKGSLLSGLSAGSVVQIVSIDAKSIQTVTVGDDGKAEIDFTRLPFGVYVVTTEKGSFKILKNN